MPTHPCSEATRWHFAYGSNMSTPRNVAWQNRRLDSRVAKLNRYRLAFNKLGDDGTMKANIVPDTGGQVWGVCYLLPESAFPVLEVQEGVARGHYVSHDVSVETATGDRLKAVADVAGQRFVRVEGMPSEEYLGFILSGAREHDLPEAYRHAIAKLAQG